MMAFNRWQVHRFSETLYLAIIMKTYNQTLFASFLLIVDTSGCPKKLRRNSFRCIYTITDSLLKIFIFHVLER